MTIAAEKTYLSEVREEAEKYLCVGTMMCDLTTEQLDALITECPKGTVRGLGFSDVWDSICDIHKSGRRVTPESVNDALAVKYASGVIKGRLDGAWIAELCTSIGGYANPVSIAFFAEKLGEIERKTRLFEIFSRAASEITTVGASADGVMAALKRDMEQEETVGTEEASLASLMDSILADVEAGEGARPIPTPWSNLNAVLKGGVAPGELVVLAARPGMGKTALAGCWAVEVARNIGPVLFVSCEVKDKTLGSRMMAREGRIDNRAFREGLGNSKFLLPKMREAAAALRKLPLEIVDSSCRIVTPAAVRKIARKIKGGPALIVVDYLQLMYPDNKHDSREREIADMSRSMKRLSVELNCPVLLLSQLNRKVEETNREPQLSDLRESGAVEQDADIVIMLHADKRDQQKADVPLKALVRKGRSSGTGAADLLFEKAFSDFRVNDGYRPDYDRTQEFDL